MANAHAIQKHNITEESRFLPLQNFLHRRPSYRKSYFILVEEEDIRFFLFVLQTCFLLLQLL